MTELARQLEEANVSSGREPERRIAAERAALHAPAYADELHLRLKPDFDQIVRERQSKVRPLRAVPKSDDAAPE